MSALEKLAKTRDAVSKRISSWDRTGGNEDFPGIGALTSKVIANIKGAGTIKHIFLTIDCPDDIHYPRKALLKMYWDNEAQPSVEVPMGDFFGVGHARLNHFVSLPLNMLCKPGGPQQHAAMNCYFPMPFASSAKIEIVNESESELKGVAYHIDYELYPALDPGVLRFHAQWRRKNPTAATIDLKNPKNNFEKVLQAKNIGGEKNYTILEAEGGGHYVGCILSIDNIDPVAGFGWFGEGDDMIFIDGEEWPPSLHGTGTEDYFCCAWGYPTGKYGAPYHGVSLAGGSTEGERAYSGKWTMYRFHIEDPIYFKKSIRFTIEHGHANCHANDYSSVAYWYQTEPHAPFPPMPSVTERLPISDHESLKRYFHNI